ncbi:MAG TPA: ABC transporter permease [Streptosporangiaceae bacterium]|jgi:ABC-2 type transport system permease protein|nr:ABC transporter permease [Streptosporangiaceae bacterium]
MSNTFGLARAEVTRLRRNKRYAIFTVALPVILYLFVAPSVKHVTVYGVSYAAYYMIAMASVGAFSGALTGNAQRIAQERKDGWVRQLRLTPLPANAYVVGKIVASMAITIPSVVIVLLLGRFYGGVHLETWKWFAIFGAIWIGSLTFTALAIAIGYRFTPDTVQPIAMVIYLVMSVLGGLWFALSGVMGHIAKFVPTYQITRIGTDLMAGQSIPATAFIVIAAWFAGFLALAVLSVRATAETV